jgi:hypothetical protein
MKSLKCNSLLKTYNPRILRFNPDRESNLFYKVSIENVGSGYGKINLMKLIINEFDYPEDRLNMCKYLKGPSGVVNLSHDNKNIYIFGSFKNSNSKCKFSESKNALYMDEFLYKLIKKTNVFLDIYADSSICKISEFIDSEDTDFSLCRIHDTLLKENNLFLKNLKGASFDSFYEKENYFFKYIKFISESTEPENKLFLAEEFIRIVGGREFIRSSLQSKLIIDYYFKKFDTLFDLNYLEFKNKCIDIYKLITNKSSTSNEQLKSHISKLSSLHRRLFSYCGNVSTLCSIFTKFENVIDQPSTADNIIINVDYINCLEYYYFFVFMGFNVDYRKLEIKETLNGVADINNIEKCLDIEEILPLF